jgi:hypothetical protein
MMEMLVLGEDGIQKLLEIQNQALNLLEGSYA